MNNSSRKDPVRPALTKRAILRRAILDGRPIFAPGVYDGLGLRVIQSYPVVDAAYISGNAVSACLLGEPDVGLVDITLLVDHLFRLNQCSRLPLIADADAGFGSVINIRRVVRALEASGVAAIHIEDQVTPKRCAQLPGNRTVIGHSEAVSRIESAVYARSDPDPLIIIGRTDSAASLGINEAIRRAKDFISVGAEAVFVELKAGQNILRDVARIAEEVRAPCMVNMSVDSRLMALPPIDWRAHGIAIGIFPALARGTFGFALQENMKRLISGNVVELVDNLMPLGVYSEVLGLSSVESWEKRFSSDSKA